MKLEYTVLWFDDQPANLRETEEGIRSRLARESSVKNVRGAGFTRWGAA
jgi:hypothetical protein